MTYFDEYDSATFCLFRDQAFQCDSDWTITPVLGWLSGEHSLFFQTEIKSQQAPLLPVFCQHHARIGLAEL